MAIRRKQWGTVHAVTTAVNIRRVPASVRSQFKAYCARRGYTMGAALVALMRKCINEDIKLPDARPKPKPTELTVGRCASCGDTTGVCECM